MGPAAFDERCALAVLVCKFTYTPFDRQQKVTREEDGDGGGDEGEGCNACSLLR